MRKINYHGTSGGYTNHHCRCKECRWAWYLVMKELRFRREKLAKSGQLKPRHGRASTYFNYRCRCDECKLAKRIYERGLRQRKLASSLGS